MPAGGIQIILWRKDSPQLQSWFVVIVVKCKQLSVVQSSVNPRASMAVLVIYTRDATATSTVLVMSREGQRRLDSNKY
jgi:hypothetical protein